MGTGERTLRMAEQNHRWGLESAPGDPPGAAHADVAQLVERWLPKPKVAGSRPVVRFSLKRARQRPRRRAPRSCRSASGPAAGRDLAPIGAANHGPERVSGAALRRSDRAKG